MVFNALNVKHLMNCLGMLQPYGIAWLTLRRDYWLHKVLGYQQVYLLYWQYYMYDCGGILLVTPAGVPLLAVEGAGVGVSIETGGGTALCSYFSYKAS